MKMAGERGMIEEAMASASVKMKGGKTRIPSSLQLAPFLPFPARMMILNHL
jgi:hypothetical protein